jgi:hypothetical protein
MLNYTTAKDINEWYIYVVMKSIFIDEIRANKIKHRYK